MLSTIYKLFIRYEHSAGVLLFISALTAIIISNSPFNHYYQLFLDLPFRISIGQYTLSKPIILWVNEGLMTIFFLMVGIEIKREWLYGELKTASKRSLPLFGALGGMIVPAIIYLALVNGRPLANNGWAIPTATDIAFSLAILSLLGKSIPNSYRIFLTALAIIDDLGAIIIIALFYTQTLSLPLLGMAAACLFMMIILNRQNIVNASPYLVIALIMWLCVLKSGVHATLVGVALAFCLPYEKTPKKSTVLTANNIETSLMPWVNYFILPLFAFANAGIPFSGMQASQLLTEIPLAIMLGLFIGKPLGIFSFCWISNWLKWTKIPNNMSKHALLGIACLCGIGFTMSLFIGTLAFETSVDNGAEIHALLYSNWVRLGVLSGSFLSAITGYTFLKWVLHKEKRSAN